MAVLEKIRVKMGVFITVLIAIALLSFVIDPTTLQSAMSMFSSKYDVGQIDGEGITYQEYQQKSRNRTKAQEQDLGAQVMDFFAQLGRMRPCAPDCDQALAWAKKLQDFFTANYYTCTPQILGSLAESYAAGGSMTENIDKAGGPGTGAFAKEVIDAYIARG